MNPLDHQRFRPAEAIDFAVRDHDAIFGWVQRWGDVPAQLAMEKIASGAPSR